MGEAQSRQRRNITLGERRTSVSLETQIWNGLNDICRRESLSVDELCRAVEARRVSSSMSSALRVFLLTYFRYVIDVLEGRDAPPPGGGSGGVRASSTLAGALKRFHSEQRISAGAD